MASLKLANTLMLMLVLLLVIQCSLQNSVYHKFGDVFRRSVKKYCTTFSDCLPSECCMTAQAETETSVGICRRKPGNGDACGLSASDVQCACRRGTTCAKSEMQQAQLKSRKVREFLLLLEDSY